MEIKLQLISWMTGGDLSNQLLQGHLDRILTITATGKQQKLARDAFQRLQISSTALPVSAGKSWHRKPELQPRDWSSEVMGNARQHRGPIAPVCGKALKHGIEVMGDPPHLRGTSRWYRLRVITIPHAHQGSFQAPQRPFHLQQQKQGPATEASTNEREQKQGWLWRPRHGRPQLHPQPDRLQWRDQLHPHMLAATRGNHHWAMGQTATQLLL